MLNTIKEIPQTKTFFQESEGYSVARKINVEWGEMDAAKIVNNTIYLKWYESARVAYLTEMAKQSGLDLPQEIGMVLSHQECKYIYPVTFPDTIWIVMKVSEILDDRFTMSCKMLSEKHDRIVAIAHATLVPFHFQSKKKIPLSQQMIEQIHAIESVKTA